MHAASAYATALSRRVQFQRHGRQTSRSLSPRREMPSAASPPAAWRGRVSLQSSLRSRRFKHEPPWPRTRPITTRGQGQRGAHRGRENGRVSPRNKRVRRLEGLPSLPPSPSRVSWTSAFLPSSQARPPTSTPVLSIPADAVRFYCSLPRSIYVYTC